MSDEVNHPPHYTAGAVEVIDIIEQIVNTYPDRKIGYSVGQAIKYLARGPLKASMLTDLKKAQWYINRAVGHATKEDVLAGSVNIGDDRVSGGTSGPAIVLPFVRDSDKLPTEPTH